MTLEDKLEVIRHEIGAVEVEANILDAIGLKGAASRLRKSTAALREHVREIARLVEEEEISTTAPPAGMFK